MPRVSLAAAMRSFAAYANVFLAKTASSQRRAGADGLGRQADANVRRGEIQVCEREQREHLGPVLGDAAITHLAIAELTLHARNTCSTFARTLPNLCTLAGRQAFFFTAQSTPAASAARLFASLA